MPPLEVTDLIEEIRDGHVLLSLLEVLLGKTVVSLVLDSSCLSSGTEYFFLMLLLSLRNYSYFFSTNSTN